MLSSRFKGALVVLAASAGLAACTNLGPYGGIGVGVGSGYGGYGGYGYGSPYGYGGYPYGSYYGRYPYFGWYDGFYYPGGGYWVYDPDGHPHPITDNQRGYWAEMLRKFREEKGKDAVVAQNFGAFRTKAKAGASIDGVNLDTHERSLRQQMVARQSARREAQQQARAERQQVRSERQESVSQTAQERREQRRARRGGGG